MRHNYMIEHYSHGHIHPTFFVTARRDGRDGQVWVDVSDSNGRRASGAYLPEQRPVSRPFRGDLAVYVSELGELALDADMRNEGEVFLAALERALLAVGDRAALDRQAIIARHAAAIAPRP